jgi:hypothetical protein
MVRNGRVDRWNDTRRTFPRIGRWAFSYKSLWHESVVNVFANAEFKLVMGDDILVRFTASPRPTPHGLQDSSRWPVKAEIPTVDEVRQKWRSFVPFPVDFMGRTDFMGKPVPCPNYPQTLWIIAPSCREPALV